MIDFEIIDQYAVVVTKEGYARLWYLGKNKTKKVFGHSDYSKSPFAGKYMIRDVQLSPEGSAFATVGDDNLMKIWSVQGYKEQKKFIGHTDEPHTVRFSKDGTKLLTSSYDKTAILWNRKSTEIIHRYKHSESVNWAEFINDDKNVISCSGNGVYIWGVNSDTLCKKFLVEPSNNKTLVWDNGSVINAIVDENKRRLFSSHYGGMIYVWDYDQGIQLHRIQAHQQRTEFLYCDLLNVLITWSKEDNVIKLWDADNYELLHMFTEHIANVNSIKLLANNKYIISSDDNGVIYLFDLIAKKVISKLGDISSPIQQIRISPNNKYLLALTDRNILKIINITTGELESEIYNDDFYECPIMNKDSDMIIAPLGSGWINVYDFPSIEKLIKFFN